MMGKKTGTGGTAVDIEIDLDALRGAVTDECYAAAFGGGVGPALLEALDAERADAQGLVDMAERWGVDPLQFRRD